ncbi:hypothetical protein [Mesorhizobium sangaii]|uniref:Uncharacterized protein n=1 Tax=Mesorhizobium sangaii TaxID=505389 RepID=A0A841PJJ4_9HYPH|nr:hypothetical protein [Mesorhizobium sangaii]MBB6414181.1 hypothetical protein [Mesorhizobium sangaii]
MLETAGGWKEGQCRDPIGFGKVARLGQEAYSSQEICCETQGKGLRGGRQGQRELFGMPRNDQDQIGAHDVSIRQTPNCNRFGTAAKFHNMRYATFISKD